MRINITPTVKARPRFNTSTGRTYTPHTTKDFEEELAWKYKQAGGKFYEGNLKVKLVFAFVPPKSWSKKKQKEALEGRIIPTKMDTDNLIKSVTDSLNGIAYTDDRYIYKVEAEKKYDTQEYIEIEIEGD